jgi:hypothetical protein
MLGRVRRAAMARRKEQGSVVVEAAIIVPILVMLAFGCIEYGLAFRDSSSVAAATRSAARIASADPGVDCTPNLCNTANSDGFWDAGRNGVNLALKDLTRAVPQELVIFKADPTTGQPWGGATYDTCTYCYVYSSWSAASKSFSNVPDLGHTPWTAAQQKADVCAGTVDAIGVYVKAKSPFITGLFGSGKTYDHVTVMRLEPAGTDLCS